MSAEGVAIYGNVTLEEISEAIRNAFPDRKIAVTRESVSKSMVQKLARTELIVGKLVPSETERMLQTRLAAKEKEYKDSEEAASKALLSIQTFHKQQQALFDEFVLLRQRYDEQKNSTINILWTHCTKFHPDLRMIPVQQDPKVFPETDDQIGEYKVGEPLGEGQFATVKNCYLEGSEKEYALKIINKDRITSFTALMRVSTEIDNLKLLKNPYIVSVNHVIHTENHLYIITEKGGRDLFEFFDEHPDGVPEDWAKQIVACVLKGVMFCHDQGICHRDLKPENILVTFDAKHGKCVDLKLCDFGLSTKFKRNVLLQDFCGSPGFFAPEMIIHGSYFGDKADVWSAGCILLELVAGHEKFCDVWMTAYDYEVLQDKEKFTDTIHDTLEQLPTVLNFSPELNDFILKFLELSQSKRPNTASLCAHPWLGDLVKDELAQRALLKLANDTMSAKMASDAISSKHAQFSLVDSPSQSQRNLLAAESADDHESESAEDRQRYIEMIFSNLSERERKHMQEYIVHHKNDGPDQHHAQMHLPPIVPSTPSIGNAKKILRKGNELANQNYHLDLHSPQSFKNVHSPAGLDPFSPAPTRQGSQSRTNSISPLPGLSENHVTEFDSSREFPNNSDKFHTPQQSAKHIGSGLRGPNSGPSNASRPVTEPRQLLFNSQSERDLQDNGPLSLSSSSH